MEVKPKMNCQILISVASWDRSRKNLGHFQGSFLGSDEGGEMVVGSSGLGLEL